MHLTEVRIKLCQCDEREPAAAAAPRHSTAGRLRAYCTLTFDNTFVIRDVKLIEGHDGLFLAMPSRKLSDHCPHCGEKIETLQLELDAGLATVEKLSAHVAGNHHSKLVSPVVSPAAVPGPAPAQPARKSAATARPGA